jgi:hypothetical protein
VRNKSDRGQGGRGVQGQVVPDQRTAPIQAPMGSHDGPLVVPDRPGARGQRSFQQANLERTAEHYDITPRQTPRR